MAQYISFLGVIPIRSLAYLYDFGHQAPLQFTVSGPTSNSGVSVDGFFLFLISRATSQRLHLNVAAGDPSSRGLTTVGFLRES